MTADLDSPTPQLDRPADYKATQPRPELSLLHHFARVTGPRAVHLCRHRLTDVLVIGVCAVLGGADSWSAIAAVGKGQAVCPLLGVAQRHSVARYLRPDLLQHRSA
jgi:hypothetical protein